MPSEEATASADTPDDVLAHRLEASTAFLEACADKPYINWRLPVINRQYTVMDVMRQASERLKK